MQIVISAIQMFPNWYKRSLKYEPTEDEVKRRRTVIEFIKKKTGKEDWATIIKIFFGVINTSSSEYLSLVEPLIKDDANFDITDSNLIATLFSCALAEKSEADPDLLHDFINLSLTCAAFYLQPAVCFGQEVLDRSKKNWLQECLRMRQLNSDDELPKQFKINSKGDLGEFSDLNIAKESTSKVSNNANKDFLAVNVELQKANKCITNLLDNQEIIAEEVNILWYLFGSFSPLTGHTFSTLPKPLFASILPLELSIRTKRLPGLGNIESLIHKGFQTIGQEALDETKFSELISAIQGFESALEVTIKEYPKQIIQLIPCFAALKTRMDFAGTEWLAIYNKDVKVNSDFKTTLINYSAQLYKESMLIKVFNEID